MRINSVFFTVGGKNSNEFCVLKNEQRGIFKTIVMVANELTGEHESSVLGCANKIIPHLAQGIIISLNLKFFHTMIENANLRNKLPELFFLSFAFVFV